KIHNFRWFGVGERLCQHWPCKRKRGCSRWTRESNCDGLLHRYREHRSPIFGQCRCLGYLAGEIKPLRMTQEIILLPASNIPTLFDFDNVHFLTSNRVKSFCTLPKKFFDEQQIDIQAHL